MCDWNECVQQVEFIVSTKVELVNEKINEFLKKCHEEKVDVVSIQPIMSYTSVGKTSDRMQGAIMIGAMITYTIPVYEEAPVEEIDYETTAEPDKVTVWHPGYCTEEPIGPETIVLLDSRNEQTP